MAAETRSIPVFGVTRLGRNGDQMRTLAVGRHTVDGCVERLKFGMIFHISVLDGLSLLPKGRI
jgi:hypothetical protein